ncbi:ABC transporter substrate-binding protein [Muricoccus nepalensis]|uniref:ABC transporter substrate-binding protein n=1 Tax=Muricoccus nepalensis TaxID=1854500 RepID=UPI001387525A|nr:ABC transporter substrate-binding protein [Roseomonas nepalensis]
MRRTAVRIGALFSGDPSHPDHPAFLEGLAALGYVEGRNLSIDARFDGGHLDRLPVLAAELAAAPVDMIIAMGAVHRRAAQQAAPGVPIVFAAVVDPVAVGLVAEAGRPDGNATGVTTFDPDEAQEGLRLLRTLIPDVRRLAVLGDAGVPDALPNVARAAAAAEGLIAQVHLLRGLDDLEDAFAAMRAARADAFVGLGVPIVRVHGARIAALAWAARLPTLLARDAAAFGPLLACGTSFAAASRNVAKLVHRILRGERAGDIPVERVVRPELVVNLDLAREFGFVIPPAVLGRTTHVRAAG